MKKKLLTILLSVFMIITTFTANVFAGGTTVNDVLPDNFPTTKESGWINENGAKLYFKDGALYINDTAFAGITSNTNIYYSSDTKNYYWSGSTGGVTLRIDFNAKKETDPPVLESITVSKTPSSEDTTYGTYTAPVVAMIGDHEYETLKEAINAATDNSETTITMLGDVSYTSFNAEDGISAAVVIPSTKKIVLDLNGKTIEGVSKTAAAAYLFHNKGYLTIVDSQGNGKITYVSNGPDCTYGYGTSTILNRGVLTIESGTVENTTTGGASYAVDNQTLWYDDVIPVVFNLKGGTVKCTTGDAAIRQGAGCGTIYTKGGEIVKNYVTISGGTVTDDIWIQNLNVSYTDLKIEGGTITGKVYTTCDDYTNMTVSISGGKINRLGRNSDNAAFMSGVVTGGLFTNKPFDGFVAEGYKCVENNDNTTKVEYPWKIGKIEVAKIGDATYPSLQAAINAAESGDTIELLKDIATDSKIDIPNGKSFTIDLKGKTITTSAVTGFEIDSANLTVKNGTVINNNSAGLSGGTMETRTKAFFVWKDGSGSLTLDNVKIESTGYSVNVDNNNNSNGAKNKKLVINNCDISSGKWAAVYAGCADASNELTIINSKLHSSYNGTTMAALQACMKTTIEKTTITNDYGAALGCFENTDLLLKGTENKFTGAAGAISTNGSKDLVQITIEGGEYKTTGTSKEAGIAFYHPDGSPLTIEGGTFEGATALYVKGGTIDIQGGSFIGTGNYAAAQEVKSGAYATGDAVVIEASNYLKEESYPHEPNPSVSISGGLFTSTNGSPVAYYTFNDNKEAHEGKMISGGWFSSKVPNTAEKDLVVSGYKASDSLKDKGAPNATNVYTVIKDIPTENLENKETGKVTVDNKTIDTTFGTMVTIDETLPNIQVSNLNKAISTAEKKKAMNDAVIGANNGDKVEIEVIMNVELAKSGKIESLAEEIEKDKAGEYNPEDVEYIDITIDKIVKANGNVIEIKEIKETDTHQIFSFPIASIFETSPDKEKVFVYRNHKIDENNEENVPFTKVEKDYGPSYNIGDGECYWLDGDYIYIKAKKFSVYGFGVQNSEIVAEKKPTPTPKPRYVIPNTGVEGTYSNNHSLLKLSSLSLLAIGTYMVIKKKKDN